MITITLSAPTPSGNKGARSAANWQVAWRKTKALQKGWVWQIRAQLPVYWTAGNASVDENILPRAKITITRYSAGTLDDDNLRAGCKALIDVLKPQAKSCPLGLGIIAGDAPHQLKCDYRQEKCPRKDARTEITIEEWVDE